MALWWLFSILSWRTPNQEARWNTTVFSLYFVKHLYIVCFMFHFSERYMISLSQHCLPKDPEKINQCFAVFAVSIFYCRNQKEVYVSIFYSRSQEVHVAWPQYVTTPQSNSTQYVRHKYARYKLLVVACCYTTSLVVYASIQASPPAMSH